MDPLTQGTIGAVVAALCARKTSLRKAALIGAIAGMAPDLDVVIKSNIDPLLKLEYHRHFTHSLFFIPFGALLIAGFLSLFRPIREMGFKHIYLFALLGYATHGILDACTNYGTYLLWPLTDERISWNVISIIDPLFTLPMFFFLIAACIKKKPRLAQIGFALSMIYMGLNITQHYRVDHFMDQIATERGHEIDRRMINPQIGRNTTWRSVYQSGDHYYIDAVTLYPWSTPTLTTGTKVKVIDPKTIFPEIPENSQQRTDILRFNHFAQGYLYHYPNQPMMLADLRYGMTPEGLDSIWGIKVTPENPNQHVIYKGLRIK